ncbi:NAD(P)-binding protein [Delitschia confertaspora ATCC 74209]|uniref:NAD(P)-binding protein n=1 Tax=Delitschia confertaspora ATCC 74209 TaxID=1513339 RepID=A0A9P4JG93_9PLEO|nr:NAD(P)-binding protein [Delitschia confertaspora ATCC 74209]
MANPYPFAGKVALITGSSKGIGAATALHLSSLGAKVVINYSSDAKPAEELIQKIGSENAIAIKADVGNIKEIEGLVQQTVDKWGKIDILIPNAGVLPMKDLESTTEEDWERCFRVNVKGVYFLCQKALPHLPPHSSIILLSSSTTILSQITPSYLLYCSSKGAIEQMARILAKDLGRRGVTVNAIAPGPTGTELFYKGKSEELLETIKGWNPFGRLGTPEEIAAAVGFLAGEGGRWVSGQVIRVNGGMA